MKLLYDMLVNKIEQIKSHRFLHNLELRNIENIIK